MDLSDLEYEEEIKTQIIDEDDTDESIPFSYSLNSYGIDFDVNGLVRRYKNGSITIPDFQREVVWSTKQCSKFIESILLGIPIPGLFFSKEDGTNNLLVIDGQQRINALSAFYTGKYRGRNFKLNDVHQDYNGLTYETLSPELKNKVDDTIIHATIVKPEDPKVRNNEGIFLIFERLNSGGMNLYPQEIRTAIYQGELLSVLTELKMDECWLRNFKINSKRKKDEEIILRLIALIYNYKNYKGNMKYFLNEFMSDNRQLDNNDPDEIKRIFRSVLDIIYEKVDIGIFKPKGNALNLAILDSFFVGFALMLEDVLEKKENIDNIIKSILEDEKYKDNIFTGKTHHRDSVISRIDIVKEKIHNASRD